MNSGTDSAMTYLVPSTSVTTVSGVQSARSTRSGFRANTAPFRRVTRITTSVLGLFQLVGPSVAGHMSIGGRSVAMRTVRSPYGSDCAADERGERGDASRAVADHGWA